MEGRRKQKNKFTSALPQRARNSKVLDLTPKRDCCRYSTGFQAPGKILWQLQKTKPHQEDKILLEQAKSVNAGRRHQMKYNYTSVHELLWEDAQEFLSVLPLFFFFKIRFTLFKFTPCTTFTTKSLICLVLETYLQHFQAADIQKSRPHSSQIFLKQTSFLTL